MGGNGRESSHVALMGGRPQLRKPSEHRSALEEAVRPRDGLWAQVVAVETVVEELKVGLGAGLGREMSKMCTRYGIKHYLSFSMS